MLIHFQSHIRSSYPRGKVADIQGNAQRKNEMEKEKQIIGADND